jgi:RNA polymerase sigma-54 factor
LFSTNTPNYGYYIYMQASFVQKQQFSVKMNPQVYQSLKLMELPLVDLREKIEEELEKNPALEVVDDRSTVSLNEDEPQQREIEEYFETSSDSGFIYSGSAGAAASDEHRRFIEGTLTRPETLQQHLLWQLQLEPIDDELRSIAAILIQNLDDDGFHKEPPETLFKKSDLFPVVPPPRLDEAIHLVQTLDPSGCCTANYKESLKAQISLLLGAPDCETAPSLTAASGQASNQRFAVPLCIGCSLDHLELFEKGKFSAAAKKMHCGEDEARACYKLMQKLSPFPGRRFAATEVRFVIPDIQVARDPNSEKGDFVIILNNEMVPVLGISPFFKELEPLKTEAKDPARVKAREFARENIRGARTFINSLAMRNRTLMLVSQALLEFQRPFFEKGPQHLVPLTLGDIASRLGIHEATVSRAANGKYMQTEWGIFELRYFFTNSISGTGSGGSRFSKGGVKAIIQELVNAEKTNLSDLDITELLAQRGILLARRTVAKYRKELDLGSSYSRR